MAAATLDLIIDKGSTFRKTLIYQTKQRVPIDMTGYTAKMQARSSYKASSTIFSLDTTNGGIVITPLEGKIDLYISDTETTVITESSGVYDLELTSPSADIIKLIKGTVRFTEEVTK